MKTVDAIVILIVVVSLFAAVKYRDSLPLETTTESGAVPVDAPGKTTIPVMKTMTAEPDTTWPLLQMVTYIAKLVQPYDMEVVSPAPASYAARYPNGGNPVDNFVWHFEAVVQGGNVPPNIAGEYEFITEMGMWFTSGADSVRCRVSGVDSVGRQGNWSEWSDWRVW